MFMTNKDKLLPADVRRENLKEWVKTNGVPQKEKSLFSQLINNNNNSSFGEKLARRLETQYQMGVGYLDKPIIGKDGKLKDHLGDLLSGDPMKGIEEGLLKCFRACPSEDRDLILLIANKLYQRARPDDLTAGPKKRRSSDVEATKKEKQKNTQ
jgi:hypothetical protein